MASPTRWTRVGRLRERVMDREAWGLQSGELDTPEWLDWARPCGGLPRCHLPAPETHAGRGLLAFPASRAMLGLTERGWWSGPRFAGLGTLPGRLVGVWAADVGWAGVRLPGPSPNRSLGLWGLWGRAAAPGCRPECSLPGPLPGAPHGPEPGRPRPQFPGPSAGLRHQVRTGVCVCSGRPPVAGAGGGVPAP